MKPKCLRAVLLAIAAVWAMPADTTYAAAGACDKLPDEGSRWICENTANCDSIDGKKMPALREACEEKKKERDDDDGGGGGIPDLIHKATGAIGGAIGGALGPIGEKIGKEAVQAADSAIASMLTSIATKLAEAFGWLIAKIADLIHRSTQPELDAPWFERTITRSLILMAVVAVITLLFGVVGAIKRRDPSGIVMLAFFRLPLSMFLAFLAAPLVEVGLSLSTELTTLWGASTLREIQGSFEDLGEVFGQTTLTAQMPVVLVIIFFALALVGEVLIWIELIIREVGIYLSVALIIVLMPLGMVRSGSRLVGKLWLFIVGLLLMEPFTVKAIELGATMMHSGDEAMVLGAGMMIMVALFAPLLPFILPSLVGWGQNSVDAAKTAAPYVGGPSVISTGAQSVNRIMSRIF